MRSYFLGTKTPFRLKPLLLLPIIFFWARVFARVLALFFFFS